MIFNRENDALDINPPTGEQHLVTHGSDWLWAITAVEVVSFLAFALLSFVARSGERVFHYIFAVSTIVASIAYFTMASDLGNIVIVASTQTGNGADRQIFYAKFINWVVQFPAAILVLGLLSGISWATIVYQIFLAWAWVICYLATSVTSTSYKWGYYCFGTILYLLLAFSTLFYDNHRAARRNGVARDHALLSGWINLLWLLYPIAFGLSDGGNKISVTPSFIFFGILDILFLPVLGFATLFLSRRWDYNKLNIAFTQYGRVAVNGGNYPEKDETAVAGGVTGPATA